MMHRLNMLGYVQDQYVVLEDPDLPRTSTGYSVLVQQLELITMTCNFVRQQLLAEGNPA